MTDWQPIETAPRDGARILVSNGESIVIAFWSIEFGQLLSVNCDINSFYKYWRYLPDLPNPKQ